MNDLHRTQFAQAGSDLADEFEEASRGMSFGRLRLAALDMSTEGGKLARQSMMVESLTGGLPAVIGWVNVAERRAEVRDHRLVAEAFEARTGQKFYLTRPQYEEALAVVDLLLRRQKVEVSKVVPAGAAAPAPAPGRAQPPAPAPGGSNALAWLVILISVLGGLGAAYYFYFMRG